MLERLRSNLQRIDFLYKIIRTLGSICFHSLYRIKIEGQENISSHGPGILLPKHQYWTDIPIVGLAAFRPASYVAKQELFVYPGIRHFLTSLGGIPLDRRNPVRSLDSFRLLEKLLVRGECIVLFPEGTYYPQVMGRGKHRLIQRILTFQKKVGKLGEKGIPFIPMGIRYQRKGWRTEVEVKIGSPLYAEQESEGQRFTQRIMEEIAKLSGLALAESSSQKVIHSKEFAET